MNSLTPYSVQLRADIDGIIRQGHGDSLSMTIRSYIHTTTYRFINTTDPGCIFENEIHDLWYILIEAGKNVSTYSFLQDSIIRYLIPTTTLGPLQRPSEDDVDQSAGKAREPTTFSDGSTLWSELPLLLSDLAEEFTRKYYQQSYNREQRVNMGGFLGRLLSAGIYNGPSLCALSLFRETLETTRPLFTDVESTGASGASLSQGDLVAALAQLTQNSEFSLVILSSKQPPVATADMRKHTDYPHLSGLGELARQAGVPISSPSGYSPQRWQFWIQRLEELSRCGVKRIEMNAGECLTSMRSAAQETRLIG